ncbi:hypothetical protein SAMN05192560_0475 [Methylobacillus rhizosphaerae]|uniref:Uncharacterized protein n=2 Tax=Methylobacillus rhizosphaerae TaxID=551994 RepID=A0A238YCY6_9PROT|nr:hypothetical protein SAMN05192560_0475 [Methylobacillus rhizosphaerae]
MSADSRSDINIYRSRKIESLPQWIDADGIKIYTISAQNKPVDQAPYLARLAEVKKSRRAGWATTPAFVIFHDGESMAYLVLAWWGNDNELFTSVSVKTASGWIEDAGQYSFCVYDLEVFWAERNYFVEQIYCLQPDLAGYRARRLVSV